ncbi:unnamed protein product, partial [Symbiodinium pilosum]
VFCLVGNYVLFAAGRSAWQIRALRKEAASASSTSTILHLVCVPIYKEPDDMVIATISRLNNITAAPRMRVIFAMEAATDRAEERFKLYRSYLSRVPEVRFYVHPVG